MTLTLLIGKAIFGEGAGGQIQQIVAAEGAVVAGGACHADFFV